MIVAFVLAVHAAAVTACLTSAVSVPTQLSIRGEATVGDILQAAGLQFSAFAGYARIATLGEEVRTG